MHLEVIGFNGTISDSMPLNQETLARSEYKVAHTQERMQLSHFLVQIGAFKNKSGAVKYQSTHANAHAIKPDSGICCARLSYLSCFIEWI